MNVRQLRPDRLARRKPCRRRGEPKLHGRSEAAQPRGAQFSQTQFNAVRRRPTYLDHLSSGESDDEPFDSLRHIIETGSRDGLPVRANVDGGHQSPTLETRDTFAR